MYFTSTGFCTVFRLGMFIPDSRVPFSLTDKRFPLPGPCSSGNSLLPTSASYTTQGASEIRRKGLEILSMRERAELSGGSLDIDPAKGKGTLIRPSLGFSQYRS